MTGTFELSGRFPARRIDDAKLTDAHILRAKLFQFFGEQIGEIELFPSARNCCLIFSDCVSIFT